MVTSGTWPTHSTMAGWRDDPKLDAWLLKPMLVLAIILAGIQVQFQDPRALAYLILGGITIVGYALSRKSSIFVWQGLGTTSSAGVGALVGVGLYLGVALLGAVISLPLAISSGVVLNLVYRWMAAVIFEEGCFRSFLYPTFKSWFNNSSIAGAVMSALAWGYFHIVALGGSVEGVLGIVVIGIAFALANEYTKSSMPSYVAHGIWNLRKVLAI